MICLRPLTLILFAEVVTAHPPVLAAPPPLVCPGGEALGQFELTVVRRDGGTPRSISTINQVLPGDRILYRPIHIDTVEKKKVRIALLLVPSDDAKIVALGPEPGDKATEWTVPFRTQLASVVWGPLGLDKAKVTSLVTKNDELIGQLADYAEKTAETQALIQAISQQQALDSGENVAAAVVGFAGRYPSARLDRTQPTDVQLGAIMQTVNPSLSAYDPLAPNPQQRAAQSAGLVAAVAGLFFGNDVGLVAGGGAVLVNLHSLMFPRTELLSAYAQTHPPVPGTAEQGAPEPTETQMTGLCGSRPQAAARAEFAFLWAMRFPDVAAPAISLHATEHLPIGVKSAIPLEVKPPKDWKLIPRVQDWRLVAADGTAVPVPVKLNTTAKTMELDLGGSKFKAGAWKLAANWDEDSIDIPGDVVLHDFPVFQTAHLTPASHDKLTAGAGEVDLDLEGDDFEFVRKVEYKKLSDPFAQAQTAPFHLPKEPPRGPQTSLKVRLDAKPLSAGPYAFSITQSDGKVHEAPFQVLPAPPSISGTPVVVNTGTASQPVTLHGSGLDRIEQISADKADISLGESEGGEARSIRVTLRPGLKQGELLGLQMRVRDFEEPIAVPDALLVGGPKPMITVARQSSQGSPGIALNTGEVAANFPVGFELNVANAPVVTGVDLACENSSGAAPLKIGMGDAKDDLKLARESADTLFLLFRPERVGQPGCLVTATLATSKSGRSESRKLARILQLPQIDSFQLTNEKAGDASYYASLEGHDLETIAKVGWDADNGTPVDSIPMPMAGPGNKESLRVAMPWPAPAPHAPLYVWLRGENRGRLAAVKY